MCIYGATRLDSESIFVGQCLLVWLAYGAQSSLKDVVVRRGPPSDQMVGYSALVFAAQRNGGLRRQMGALDPQCQSVVEASEHQIVSAFHILLASIERWRVERMALTCAEHQRSLLPCF